MDAPEVSEQNVPKTPDDGWADSVATTMAWGGGNNNINSESGKGVAELLDMQSLKEDDVAERLRIEETKAQLARAKEGMAKEAERLEREKREKEEKAAARTESTTVGGGKWVPSHLRGSSIRGPATMTMGAKQPNVSDEELFPDLASADKILAEKKEKMEASSERASTIRAPTGWGNRGGGAVAAGTTRQPLNLAPRTNEERKPLNLAPPTKKEEDAPAVVEETVEKKEEETAPASADAEVSKTETKAETAEAPKKDIKLKKKKKKDLSSFKPSS